MPAVILCVLCDEPVDPRKTGTFRKVIGWAETRKRGGTNAITERIELNEYAHGPCMKLRRMGVSTGQGNLFGDKT